MSHSVGEGESQASRIEELESLQDEVLHELDQLNGRIEALLRSATHLHADPAPAAA